MLGLTLNKEMSLTEMNYMHLKLDACTSSAPWKGGFLFPMNHVYRKVSNITRHKCQSITKECR